MEDSVKIVVLGDINTGKTAFVKKCAHDVFDIRYKSTIGVDFVTLKQVEDTKVQFWDIAGQERFRNMLRVYFKEAKCAIICCDVTRESTILACEQWFIALRAMLDDEIPTYIVGLKCDLLKNDDLEKVKTKVRDLYEKQVNKIVFLSNLKDGQQTLIDQVIKPLIQETPVKFSEVSDGEKIEALGSLEQMLNDLVNNSICEETRNLVDEILNFEKSGDLVQQSCKVEHLSQKEAIIPEESKLHWLVSGTTKMDNSLFKQMIMFGYITKANFEIFKNCFKRNVKLERDSLTDVELDLVVTHYKTQNYGVVISPDAKYLTITW
jgi:small GTP-binding protein